MDKIYVHALHVTYKIFDHICIWFSAVIVLSKVVTCIAYKIPFCDATTITYISVSHHFLRLIFYELREIQFFLFATSFFLPIAFCLVILSVCVCVCTTNIRNAIFCNNNHHHCWEYGVCNDGPIYYTCICKLNQMYSIRFSPWNIVQHTHIDTHTQTV